MVGASRFGNAGTSWGCFRGAVTTSAIAPHPSRATNSPSKTREIFGRQAPGHARPIRREVRLGQGQDIALVALPDRSVANDPQPHFNGSRGRRLVLNRRHGSVYRSIAAIPMAT